MTGPARRPGDLAALALTAALAACAVEPDKYTADIVFLNGAVYTVDERRSWASAVAVRGGRISYVGGDAAVELLIGEDTEVIGLDGRMLMPGFHDSHMHPMAAGTRFLRCQLGGLAWPDEVLAKIAACADSLEKGLWLRGIGLADRVFEERPLHKSMLDGIAPDRPVHITNQSGFMVWMNSRGLEAAGIDAGTPDPEQGTIERDPVSGEPTGVLRGTGIALSYAKLPVPGTQDLRLALRLASEMANRFGITSANASSVRPQLLNAYLEAEAAGEMTLRIQASQRWDRELGLGQIEAFDDNRTLAGAGRFRADAVKFFLDGDISFRTAALLEPYAGSVDDRGNMNFTTPVLREAVARLDAEGFQIHMHAVGDRAVRTGLDAIEHAITANGARERRHQIAHIKLVHPGDISRFKSLGVTADFQPLWAQRDAALVADIEVLGPERARWLVRMAGIVETGAHFVAGSDWASESMNPLDVIQVAVTRRPLDGGKLTFLPQERVGLADMLEAYTINGAWLARQEDETGSIEVGKAADLIVLERNLFEIDPMELKDVQVLLTLLEGETVYRASEYSP